MVKVITVTLVIALGFAVLGVCLAVANPIFGLPLIYALCALACLAVTAIVLIVLIAIDILKEADDATD